MWENWALYTQNANTRSQFWLEIGTILLTVKDERTL